MKLLRTKTLNGENCTIFTTNYLKCHIKKQFSYSVKNKTFLKDVFIKVEMLSRNDFEQEDFQLSDISYVTLR